MKALRIPAFAILLLVPGLALAQSPADRAYTQSMQAMQDKMRAMKPTGDPDMDFVMMMAPHHQAAVEMATAYLKYGSDPELKKMAQDIVSSQKREIGQMKDWESRHGM